jgi:hypothetical protein
MDEIYSTTSLNLASYLFVKNKKKFISMNFEGNSNRFAFKFRDIDQATVDEFYQNGLVGCQDLFNAMKTLKNMMYDSGKQ